MLRSEDPDQPEGIPTAASPRLVLSLLSITKSTRALTGLKLAEMGFANGQDELLVALDEERAVKVTVIADLVRVRPSTVSKMLDRLVPKGLVERCVNHSDLRNTMVRITPAGLDARSRLLEMRATLEEELVSSCPGGLNEAVESLEHLAGILQNRLRRLR